MAHILWKPTPVELERKRRVQLILIEGISGSLMKHIRPSEMPQKTRQTIMKTLIDFDTIVYSRGIILADLHPRDVILTDAVQGRAVFLDFAAAEFFWSDTLSDSEARCLQTTDISPLLRWDEAWGRFEEFGKWIDWDWQPWLEAEFDIQRPGSRQRYEKCFYLLGLLKDMRSISNSKYVFSCLFPSSSILALMVSS